MDSPKQVSSAQSSLASQTQQLRRNLQTPISAPRIALERKISLRFPHFQGFLTEYCSNISITGMFIESSEPRPPGQILDFELNLIDGLKLIRGTGEVVWVRATDEGPQLPAGMGIRFLRLDAESRRLIRWAVEKQISAGGQPFDLEAFDSEDLESLGTFDEQDLAQTADLQGNGRPDPQRPRASTPVPPTRAKGTAIVDARRRYPYAGYAVARRSDWRSRMLAGGTVVLPVTILAVAILMSPKRQPPAFASGPAVEATSPTSGPEVSVGEAETERARDTDGGLSEITDPEQSPAVSNPREEVIAAIQAWAQAWAEQRPEDYLQHYSQRFQPPRAMARDAWESQRTERISSPDFIRVDVSGLETEMLGVDRARVTFDQAYRSDNFRDTMRKALELVREGDCWKILEERTAG